MLNSTAVLWWQLPSPSCGYCSLLFLGSFRLWQAAEGLRDAKSKVLNISVYFSYQLKPPLGSSCLMGGCVSQPCAVHCLSGVAVVALVGSAGGEPMFGSGWKAVVVSFLGLQASASDIFKFLTVMSQWMPNEALPHLQPFLPLSSSVYVLTVVLWAPTRALPPPALL